MIPDKRDAAAFGVVIFFSVAFVLSWVLTWPIRDETTKHEKRDEYMLKNHNAVWSDEQNAYILKIIPEIKKIEKIEFSNNKEEK